MPELWDVFARGVAVGFGLGLVVMGLAFLHALRAIRRARRVPGNREAQA